MKRLLSYAISVSVNESRSAMVTAPAKIGLYVILVTNHLPGLWQAPQSKRCLFLKTADRRRPPCIPP
jgi:hypothetical protein